MTDPKKDLEQDLEQDPDIDGPETDEELVREWEAESFPSSDAPQNY